MDVSWGSFIAGFLGGLVVGETALLLALALCRRPAGGSTDVAVERIRGAEVASISPASHPDYFKELLDS